MGNFGQLPLQILIANISGTKQHIQNRKDARPSAIPPSFELMKKSGELWPTNYKELHVSLDPLKCTCLGDYILFIYSIHDHEFIF